MTHPSVLLLQVTTAVAVAATGVSVKDLATILGVIAAFVSFLTGAFKLGSFSADLSATKRDALSAVTDVRDELQTITSHMAEEAKQRIAWSEWRGGIDRRVGDVERRVGELEP